MGRGRPNVESRGLAHLEAVQDLFVSGTLSVSGSMVVASLSAGSGYLILSSSVGSVVHVSGNLSISGQSWSEIAATETPTGTTQTLDFNDSNSHVLDLESATGDVTLTLSNPQPGASYVIKVIQDSAVARDVVWPPAVLWAGGVPPVISTGADAVDIVTLWWDGTNYFGNVGPDYS